METAENYLLKMDQIEKKFANIKVLKNVQFRLRQGEIHALVGANGAGKSTLMKVLAGIYPDYEGNVVLNGCEVKLSNPRQALELGIALIYQEFHLVPQLTVAENILLGREPLYRIGGVPFVNWSKLKETAAEILSDLRFALPLEAKVAQLGVADQQLVQIAKAMAAQAKVLVMDEPTARLSRKERDNLFQIMKRLEEAGTGIVYISHFLEEVFMIAEVVTVLRDGENAGTLAVKELSHSQLVKMMLGHEVVAGNYQRLSKKGPILLKVEHLNQAHKFYDINFSLHVGEILGIAGLVGSGRTELVRAIFGAENHQLIEGRIEVDGKSVCFKTPQKAINAGLTLAPEDRKQQGLVLIRPVADNILMASTQRLRRGPFLNLKARRSVTAEMIDRLKIRCPDPQVPAGTLSGGNQQKVVLAKWLATKARILILDQPTAGIDIGTKEEIYHLLSQLAEEGTGLIVISDDPEELSRICQRVLIMRKGRIVKELDANPTSEEVLAGVTAEYALV
jgi:ABC-type sugar transport system ATPase subunit